MRLASLPMYALPGLGEVTDQWWSGIARHLRAAGVPDVPHCLSRRAGMQAWHDPALLLSQTCGYPLTHALAGKLRVIGTPVYRAAGCDGPRYASVLVVREQSRAGALEELRGGVCVVNGTDSHSGYNVLRGMLAPLSCGRAFFARVLESGSHAASLRQVGEGQADVCAVDCVTHALLSLHAPAMLAGTRVLGFSASAPGLPYVSSGLVSEQEADTIRQALDMAMADPSLSDARAALLIDGIAHLPEKAYDEITDMETTSRGMGYPALV